MSDHTHAITVDNFRETIERDGIVVLDWWASWCGPCVRFAPVFEAAAAKHADIYFGKIDTEDQPQLSQAFEVMSIPTIMVFRDSILVYRESGALPPPMFEKLLTQVRSLDMDEVRKQVAANGGADGESSGEAGGEAPS